MKSDTSPSHVETPRAMAGPLGWPMFEDGSPLTMDVAASDVDVAAVDGYTKLALAVIEKALDDADPRRPERTRDQALRFLSGGPALSWWCALAGVEPETITRRSVSARSAA